MDVTSLSTEHHTDIRMDNKDVEKPLVHLSNITFGKHKSEETISHGAELDSKHTCVDSLGEGAHTLSVHVDKPWTKEGDITIPKEKHEKDEHLPKADGTHDHVVSSRAPTERDKSNEVPDSEDDHPGGHPLDIETWDTFLKHTGLATDSEVSIKTLR